MASEFGFEPVCTGDYYFISYNSEDKNRVAKICQSMNNDKIPLWYDKGLHYGDEWQTEIAVRIKNSISVILFFSKGILEKDNSFVQKEYDLAKLYKKKIIIVFIDDIDENRVSTNKAMWWVEIMRKQVITTQKNVNDYCNEIYKAIDFDPKHIDEEKIKKYKITELTNTINVIKSKLNYHREKALDLNKQIEQIEVNQNCLCDKLEEIKKEMEINQEQKSKFELEMENNSSVLNILTLQLKDLLTQLEVLKQEANGK